MLPTWLLCAALPLCLQSTGAAVQSGEPTAVVQNDGRSQSGWHGKMYEVRDIFERMASGWNDDDSNEGRDALELRIRRYAEQKRASDAGGWYESQLASLVHEQRMADASNEFARIVRQYMLPAFEPDRCSLKSTSNALVVSASEPQLAWVEAFLDRQRAAKDMIEIQARFLTGPRGCFKEFADNASKTLPSQELLDAALARITTPLHTVLAPKLLNLNLMLASLSVVDQIAYVADYRVRTVEPGPREIAEPVIQTIEHGITVRARAFELADDSYGLSLETSLADLKRPIPTSKIPLQINGAVQEVEIALPAVETVRFKSDVQVKNGGSAIFVARYGDDRDLALIVTVRRGPLPSTLDSGVEDK